MYLNEQKQRSKSVANFSSKEWIVLSKEDQKVFWAIKIHYYTSLL